MKTADLKTAFRPYVYPYAGSGFMTGTEDEDVIERNAQICADIAVQYASQFKPKWIYTEPETDGTYLIAFKFGVTEGKFWHGKYLTSDFSQELPAAYAYMAMPDKPEPPKTV